MKVSDVFEEMRALLHVRAELLRRMERAREEAEACGACMNGMPRAAGYGARLERIGLELADLNRELQQVEEELNVYRRKVQPLIERMPAGTPRVLLRLRYVDFKSVAQVAGCAGYSRQNAYRALKKAETDVVAGDATA